MPPKAAASAASFLVPPENIQITDMNLANPLGQGSYGIVYKGSYQKMQVAIKQLLVPDLTPKHLAEFKQEVELMASFRHDHIIRLYGFTQTKPYRIVMEFMAKGSLFQVLHSEEELSWVQRMQWAKEIAMGIDYLHTREPKIIHRDLKSLNILINGHDQAKLCDFGSAIAKLRTATATSTTKSYEAKQNQNLVGSTRWMAPELFEEALDPTYTTATDMFAYAIVLWEMAARELPYVKVTEDARVERLIQSGKRATIDFTWPDIFQTLLPLCWHPDPNQRPSASKVIESFEKATPPEPIDPAARDAYIDSSIKPIYEDFLKKVASLMTVHHTVFISYAWPKLPEEKELQLFLERLYDDFTQHLQLQVIWDLKSLKPGMDIEEFMRRGVLDSYRVLMVGTPTYAERAADVFTNVSREVTHMARKREIERNSIVPLLYCGQWATAFPRGYNQVLAITESCDRYENFYKVIPSLLYVLLGLLEEDKKLYDQYTQAFLAEVNKLLLSITDDQICAFNQANRSKQKKTLIETQQLLTRDCNLISQIYPHYQPDHSSQPTELTLTVSKKVAMAEPKPPALATVTSYFPSPAKADISQTDVKKLLLHVARGEQEHAEAMLKIKDNEALLLYKGPVTDYSNRIFKNITAFQYALWALDWHMWKMLKTYLPDREALEQLQELETKSTEHGSQYDFGCLIYRLRECFGYDNLPLTHRQHHWITLVGSAQATVPAHVANEYCHPYRAFRVKYSSPSFTEDTLPRTLDISRNKSKFFPLSRYTEGSLGTDFAIYRNDHQDWPMLVTKTSSTGLSWGTPNPADLISNDCSAIRKLSTVRTQQYQAFKDQLLTQLQSQPRCQANFNKLLLHVAKGEQDQAEQMLKIKGNEVLLLLKGEVCDYSHRTFKNITAFQYALWALDWHMWKMLRKYLSNEEAARQIHDLEKHSTEHGTHYNFKPLTQALKTYLDNFVASSDQEKATQWIKMIGGAQATLPVHVANEYCRRDRPFRPTPSFTEGHLPRTLVISDDHKFYPPFYGSSGALSITFGIARGDSEYAVIEDSWFDSVMTIRYARIDLATMSTLSQIRMQQYKELKRELAAQLDAHLRSDQAEVDLPTLKPDLETLSLKEKTKGLEIKPVTTPIGVKTNKSPFDDIDDIFDSKIASAALPTHPAAVSTRTKTKASLFGDSDDDIEEPARPTVASTSTKISLFGGKDTHFAPKTSSLFGDDDSDDDLFGCSKTKKA